MARHSQSGLVVALQDQAFETRRTGDIGTLADIDEQRIRTDVQRLQAAQAALGCYFRNPPWANILYRFGDGLNVGRRRPAAPADDIQEPACGPFLDVSCHKLRGVIELTEFVGQTGIGMGADMGIGNIGNLFHVLPQLFHAERAIQTDA